MNINVLNHKRLFTFIPLWIKEKQQILGRVYFIDQLHDILTATLFDILYRRKSRYVCIIIKDEPPPPNFQHVWDLLKTITVTILTFRLLLIVKTPLQVSIPLFFST